MSTALIIPAYNCAKWIGETLECALAQTLPFEEIVVVDDGSTDTTADVVRAYGSRVRLIVQENCGISAARNAGILASDSDLVMLCDADDLLLPTCHETRIAALDSVEGAGLAAGAHRYIDEAGTVIQAIGEAVPFESGLPFSQVLRGAHWPTPGWLIRRETFERCGLFDPLLAACEDWEFLLRVASRSPLAYDPEVGVSVRILPGSQSSNYLRMLDGGAAALRKVRAYAPVGSRFRLNCLRGFSHHLSGVLYRMIRRDPGSGWPKLFRLLARRPALLAYFPYLGLVFAARRIGIR